MKVLFTEFLVKTYWIRKISTFPRINCPRTASWHAIHWNQLSLSIHPMLTTVFSSYLPFFWESWTSLSSCHRPRLCHDSIFHFFSSLRVGQWRTFRRGSWPWTPWWSRRSKRSGKSISPSGSQSWMPLRLRRGGNKTSEWGCTRVFGELWIAHLTFVSQHFCSVIFPQHLCELRNVRQWEGLPWRSSCHLDECIYVGQVYI